MPNAGTVATSTFDSGILAIFDSRSFNEYHRTWRLQTSSNSKDLGSNVFILDSHTA